MATQNCPALGPRDSLRRDSLVLVPVIHARAAFKLVLGALLAVLLLIAGSSAPDGSRKVERLVLPGAAPVPEIAVGETDAAGGRVR